MPLNLFLESIETIYAAILNLQWIKQSAVDYTDTASAQPLSIKQTMLTF